MPFKNTAFGNNHCRRFNITHNLTAVNNFNLLFSKNIPYYFSAEYYDLSFNISLDITVFSDNNISISVNVTLNTSINADSRLCNNIPLYFGFSTYQTVYFSIFIFFHPEHRRLL